MAETETIDKLMRELGEQVLEREFCQSTAKSFNRSAARAGKPIVKWTELQSWFENRVKESPNICRNYPSNKAHKSSEIPKVASHKYDVEKFLAHRFLSTGETEVRVRFVGFGAKEDEWVNVKKAVRERSVPLEHSECRTLKVGDHVLCILERRDEAIYYDSHIYRFPKENARYKGPPVSSESGTSPFEEIVSSPKTLDAACVFSS
ncbi:hypothetical protein C1H46_023267 [Malus baccata]|uniref:SAWADEE domain-containing protein n=1 Tax=Malus baccata TaxID=106549 RepID=A0A540LXJ4_MALBA|nr:hypothetical protein C1H46_023267 [Malus baccata]